MLSDSHTVACSRRHPRHGRRPRLGSEQHGATPNPMSSVTPARQPTLAATTGRQPAVGACIAVSPCAPRKCHTRPANLLHLLLWRNSSFRSEWMRVSPVRASVVWKCFALICVLPSPPVLAGSPGVHLSQLEHSTWRLQDGVFNGAPRGIAQTADGYLWIGTLRGLVRFDGVRFVPWKPPENQPLAHWSSGHFLPDATGVSGSEHQLASPTGPTVT